jgi:hypothetical protein
MTENITLFAYVLQVILAFKLWRFSRFVDICLRVYLS